MSAYFNQVYDDKPNLKTFKNYYDKKMSEGRNHYNTLGHCDGKLVRIIYMMRTDNVPFHLE